MSIQTAFFVWILILACVASNSAVALDDTSVVPDACRPLKIECYGGDRDNFRDPDPFGSEITIHQFRIDGLAVDEQKPGPFQGKLAIGEGSNDFTRLRHYHENQLEVPNNAWLHQRLLERVSFASGSVVKGDILPINGALYVVERCQQSEFQSDMANITLARMPRDKWPDGILCDEFAYALTTGGSIWTATIGFVARGQIHVEWDENKHDYQLKVSSQIGTSPTTGRTVEEIFAARPGVPFALEAAGQISHFQIVSVVAPNPESHIPGWVELRRVWPAIPPFGVPSPAPVE